VCCVTCDVMCDMCDVMCDVCVMCALEVISECVLCFHILHAVHLQEISVYHWCSHSQLCYQATHTTIT